MTQWEGWEVTISPSPPFDNSTWSSRSPRYTKPSPPITRKKVKQKKSSGEKNSCTIM